MLQHAGSAGPARDTPNSTGNVCEEGPKRTSRVHTDDPPGILVLLQHILNIMLGFYLFLGGVGRGGFEGPNFLVLAWYTVKVTIISPNAVNIFSHNLNNSTISPA